MKRVLMNSLDRSTPAVALAIALFCGLAVAQTAPADPGAPPPTHVQSSGGVDYINGGAGEEARAEMAGQRSDFALRIVFSVLGGAFAVAEHVDVSKGGAKVLGVDDAGPMLLVKLAPGDYAVDAVYKGKTQSRQVRIGSAPTTLEWRLDSDAKRP